MRIKTGDKLIKYKCKHCGNIVRKKEVSDIIYNECFNWIVEGFGEDKEKIETKKFLKISKDLIQRNRR